MPLGDSRDYMPSEKQGIYKSMPWRHYNIFTVGRDDTGYDVTFYGATSGKKWLWDESADTMVVYGEQAFSGAIANCIDFSAVTSSTNTDGTFITTGSTWVDFATAGQCAVKFLCSTSATSGDFATFRSRAKALAAGNASAGNFSASAGANNYGDLRAVEGYAQPNTYTQATASNIVCGVYSCIDKASGATSGRHWSLWTDDHSNVKASGGHYLHRLSNNSTNSTSYDGIWTIYAGAGCTYLMNFEGTNAPVTSGDKTGGTKSYSLACYIDGAVRYVQLYDAA